MRESEAFKLVKLGRELSKLEFKIFEFLMGEEKFSGNYTGLSETLGLKREGCSNVRKAVLSLERKKLICVWRRSSDSLAKNEDYNLKNDPMIGCYVYEGWENNVVEEA